MAIFEFVFRRGPQLVYIVETKKYDMDQGWEPAVLGLEASVEVDKPDT